MPTLNPNICRTRFRRARLQTPNSVSFLALAEFRGEGSVSSSRSTICVPSAELTEFAAELSEFSLPKQYSARFLIWERSGTMQKRTMSVVRCVGRSPRMAMRYSMPPLS